MDKKYRPTQAVFRVIQEAFRHAEYSDQTEHLIVEGLRRSAAFVPELSLVAKLEKRIVRHILLTKVIELMESAMENMQGIVQYPEAFYT